jgi:hypothetical protein
LPAPAFPPVIGRRIQQRGDACARKHPTKPVGRQRAQQRLQTGTGDSLESSCHEFEPKQEQHQTADQHADDFDQVQVGTRLHGDGASRTRNRAIVRVSSINSCDFLGRVENGRGITRSSGHGAYFRWLRKSNQFVSVRSSRIARIDLESIQIF